MRYAIIADIHANLEAFTAVLDDIEHQGGVEELWCLGDVVGYGPDPHQCLELLQKYRHVCVAGNHDWAVTGKLDTAVFRFEAAYACQWTARQLNISDIEYLDRLPEIIKKGDFTLVHGSPRAPVWEYLLSEYEAQQNRDYFESRYCLVGHSHVPLIFEFNPAGVCSMRELRSDETIRLSENRLIINPGGVGQPRDGDPRASYIIYDDEASAISHYRVAYDIGVTQGKMMEHGLPSGLVERLSYGM